MGQQLLAADFNIDCYEIDDERFYLHLDVTRLGSTSVTDEGECFINDGVFNALFVNFWVGEIEVNSIAQLQYSDNSKEFSEFNTDCLTPNNQDTCLYYNHVIDSTAFIQDDRDRRIDLIAKEIHISKYINLAPEGNWSYADTFQLLLQGVIALNRTARTSYLMTTHQYPVEFESRIDLDAVDTEGDSLVYRFAQPHGKPTSQGIINWMDVPSEMQPFPYAPGFSAFEPMGPGGLIINNETNQLILNPTQTGRYFIHMIVEEYRNGELLCAKPFFFPIWIIEKQPTLQPAVEADEYVEDLAIIKLCDVEEYLMQNQSTSYSTLEHFYWLMDGDTLFNWEPSLTFSDPGIYNLELVLEDSLGCSASLPIQIQVGETPLADFEVSALELTAGETVEFSNTSLGDIAISQWQLSNGEMFTSQDLSYHFIDTGLIEIQLEVTDEFGCQNFHTKVLKINPPESIYIPNAFSPNGDGMNDEFRPLGNFEFISNYKIEIYNRWGALVFQSDDPSIGWLGQSTKEVALQEGIYVYQITYNNYRGESKIEIGDVLLIR